MKSVSEAVESCSTQSRGVVQRKNFFSGSSNFRMNLFLWDVVTLISVSCIYQCLITTALGISLQLSYPPLP